MFALFTTTAAIIVVVFVKPFPQTIVMNSLSFRMNPAINGYNLPDGNALLSTKNNKQQQQPKSRTKK